MLFVIDVLFVSIAVLSLAGSGSFLVYLMSTERSAPDFTNSLKSIKQNSYDDLLVSVVVPARNEEQMILRCLKSLVRQSHKNLEIVVVDDSSTDNTRAVVDSFAGQDKRIELVWAGTKPAGWVGKSWPCWRGYEHSTGDFILFVDADSTLEQSTIEDCLEYVVEKGIDIFSLSPRVKMDSVYAKAVLPIISSAINLLYPMQKVNDSKSDRAYVFGTFVLVRRVAYDATGGHRTVSSELVEDAAIARNFKKSGFNLRIERGPEFLSTEWERDFKSIYNGLERIISSSVRSYGLISIFNAVLLFFVTLFPIVFVSIYIAVHPTSLILLFGLIASLISIIAFFALTGFETNMVSGRIGISTLLYPLGIIFFITAIVSTSIKVSTHKEIKWKDQNYIQSRLV